ncbi:2-methylaconitate cis-trans isomerase PrpF family protein [Apibacter sp. HY039]|uniref:2-methylaconitate cis-trans isomerase PrpF family protein n=1 Tax=Apibacter sp. HY039 TaxID=2501476 RepID=UPI000FEB6BB3|nr:PrpF domain-containing protein [Apibacter sp. HY039]
MKKINCIWMRGGTSKGGCFLENDLPESIEEQDHILTAIYGGNDPTGKQFNGMGGATSTTSKAVIVKKRNGEKNAVNYTFAQVDITTSLVDRKGNCGNMSAAVAPFAIEMGLIDDVQEPITQVSIFNTNTSKIIIAHLPVKDGKVVYEGNYAISGVPGTASKIQLDFLEPGGAVTKKLLPTGNVIDVLSTPDYGDFEVSIVDAANPLVFVWAKDLGLTGSEQPLDIDSNPELLKKMLSIREAASVKMGLTTSIEEAKKIPAIPKFCFVAEAADYKASNGETIKKDQIDLQARMLSMGKLHPNYAITGGICTGVAAKIPGTIVNQIIGKASEQEEIRIGHCGGLLSVGAKVAEEDGQVKALLGTVFRTVKKLMKGEVYW